MKKVPDHVLGLVGYVDARNALARAHSFEQLALFRRHLAPSIRIASPVIRALCQTDLNLSSALNWMQPPVARPKPKPWWPAPPLDGGRAGPDEHPRAFRLRHRTLGVIERWPTDPRGRLGIRLRSGCLDAEVSIGASVLWTAGPIAHLLLADSVPATVAAAMPGRSVEALVSHPLLAGGYEMTAVEQLDHGWTEITFSTGTVGCQVSVVHGQLTAQLDTGGEQLPLDLK